MTKFLNIDELLPKQKREAVIGGVTYEVRASITTKEQIQAEQIYKQITDSKIYEQQLNLTMDAIQIYIKQVDREQLLSLTLDQLKYLAWFARGVDSEQIIKAYDTDNPKEGGETEVTQEADVAEEHSGNV